MNQYLVVASVIGNIEMRVEIVLFPQVTRLRDFEIMVKSLLANVLSNTTSPSELQPYSHSFNKCY